MDCKIRDTNYTNVFGTNHNKNNQNNACIESNKLTFRRLLFGEPFQTVFFETIRQHNKQISVAQHTPIKSGFPRCFVSDFAMRCKQFQPTKQTHLPKKRAKNKLFGFKTRIVYFCLLQICNRLSKLHLLCIYLFRCEENVNFSTYGCDR